MEIRNEFARVAVDIDEQGNGPRLRLRDLKTGRVAFLDALELESLAWSSHADLNPFLNPSLGRWRDHDDSGVETMLRRLGVASER